MNKIVQYNRLKNISDIKDEIISNIQKFGLKSYLFIIGAWFINNYTYLNEYRKYLDTGIEVAARLRVAFRKNSTVNPITFKDIKNILDIISLYICHYN